MIVEIEKLRQLAEACRKQAQIASTRETAMALLQIAETYEREADDLARSGTHNDMDAGALL